MQSGAIVKTSEWRSYFRLVMRIWGRLHYDLPAFKILFVSPGTIQMRVDQLREKMDFLQEKIIGQIGERAWSVLTFPFAPFVYVGTWVASTLVLPVLSFLFERGEPIRTPAEIELREDWDRFKEFVRLGGRIELRYK